MGQAASTRKILEDLVAEIEPHNVYPGLSEKARKTQERELMNPRQPAIRVSDAEKSVMVTLNLLCSTAPMQKTTCYEMRAAVDAT